MRVVCSQIVPYVGDNERYNVALTSLLIGVGYEIQIQTLDRNSYVLYTSATASAHSSCQAPTQPPSHVSVDAPDARHVRVTWAQPPTGSWRCAQIFYEVQVDEPTTTQAGAQQPVRVDGKMTSHVFDAAPEQRWTVRVRVANAAGQSPWSPSVSTRSSSSSAASDLIEGPFVSSAQGVPRVSWRVQSGASVDSLSRFQLEWKNQNAQRWNSHRQTVSGERRAAARARIATLKFDRHLIARQFQVNFAGWQRPYSIDVNDLPPGHQYEIRVRALDSRGGLVAESPSVALHTSRACSPPRRPPYNVAVTPLGPTQIRLSWAPLSEAEWNCDSLWYVVKYSSPETQGYRNVSAGENNVVLDSKPYTNWEFEVQAVNPAGASSWSRALSSQTLSTSPGAVSDLQMYPSADSVQLSWRPPASPNGVSIQSITRQDATRSNKRLRVAQFLYSKLQTKIACI